MSVRTLLVVGNDRLSRQATKQTEGLAGVAVAIDGSTNVLRIFKLLRRGRLSLSLLAKMVWAERRRRSVEISVHYPIVSNNAELVRLMRDLDPERVVLFRAGLIVNRTVLSAGVPIMNIHCARIPGYGGIASVHRALNDGAYSQCATLHQVTETIDDGVVHATEPYQLDPREGYGWNEDQAYLAGLRLLKRVLA